MDRLFESCAAAEPSSAPSSAPLDDDAVRNAFDVLCLVPARFEDQDGQPYEPWCHWPPPAKRARTKGEAAGDASAAPRWLDAARRRHAFSEAWLTFLRLQLPMDLYKARFFGAPFPSPPHTMNARSLECNPTHKPR